MAFADKGMTWIAFTTHQLGAQEAMTDIFRGPMTINLRRITTVYTNIMQHGCLLDKLQI